MLEEIVWRDLDELEEEGIELLGLTLDTLEFGELFLTAKRQFSSDDVSTDYRVVELFDGDGEPCVVITRAELAKLRVGRQGI